MYYLVEKIFHDMRNYQVLLPRLFPREEAHTAELLDLQAFGLSHPLKEVLRQMMKQYTRVLAITQGQVPLKDGTMPRTREQVLNQFAEVEFIPSPLDTSLLPQDVGQAKILGSL